MASIVIGQAPLTDERYRAPFLRIGAKSEETIQNGRRPKTDTDSPANWRERIWNQPADHLANLAMNGKALAVMVMNITVSRIETNCIP